MDFMRKLERQIYKAEEPGYDNYDDYPWMSDSEIIIAESENPADHVSEFMMPFVRIKPDKWYIELCFVGKHDDGNKAYDRFIIQNGCRMDEYTEDWFLCHVRGLFYTRSDMYEDFIRRIVTICPEWHLTQYGDHIGKMLEQIYFVSHKGIREILYKGGLEKIAENIDKVPDINLVGTTLETIVGHGLSLKLLQIINRLDLIELLFDEKTIDVCREAYNRYSGYIDRNKISLGQWNYLMELTVTEDAFAGAGFNRTVFRRLKDAGSEGSLLAYEKFFCYRKEFEQFKKLKIPPVKDIDDVVNQLDKVYEYFGNNIPETNAMIVYRKSCNVYEYKGGRYAVICPGDILDFCRESIVQWSCILDYVESHAAGETTILFLRKTDNVSKPFVTMEIRDNEIKQVYGKYNRLPPIDVYRFLEEYSAKMGVKYDPYHLITRFLEEIEEYDDYLPETYKEHEEYAEYFKCGNSNYLLAEDGTSYIQLSFKDLFPEIWGM